VFLPNFSEQSVRLILLTDLDSIVGKKMRKIKNARIFTSKTLCSTKVKTTTYHRRIFTLHYHGQIGYKVTQPVTSNSHTMSNTYGHADHTVLVSPRLGHNTHS